MRKLTAIFLLTIHLYTLGGCLLVRQVMVYRSRAFYNEQAAKKLYDSRDIVEIKILVQVGDIPDMKTYQPVSGRICFAESSYNYVAMKMTKNALFLQCLPNYKSTLLNTQNVIHAEHIKGIPIPPKDHVPEAKFIFMHGFDLAFREVVLSVPVTVLSLTIPEYKNSLISRHVDIPTQPPKFS